MIIDSHCHLNYEPIYENVSEVIARARSNGVKTLLTIATEDKNFYQILKIIKKFDQVFGTYGIHPHEAKNHINYKSHNILDKVSLNEKIIGIGETGLDFYYNHSDKKQQIDLFEEHISASQVSKKPIIIHTRSAEKETYDLLYKASKKKDLKILIHCFTGSKEFSKKLLDLGSYISASGIVTFKKSYDLANTFKEIPINRILVETDSPYLSPEPMRGKSNEPSNIMYTAKFLCRIKNIQLEEFAKITTDNFYELFGRINEK